MFSFPRPRNTQRKRATGETSATHTHTLSIPTGFTFHTSLNSSQITLSPFPTLLSTLHFSTLSFTHSLYISSTPRQHLVHTFVRAQAEPHAPRTRVPVLPIHVGPLFLTLPKRRTALKLLSFTVSRVTSPRYIYLPLFQHITTRVPRLTISRTSIFQLTLEHL